MMMVNGEVSATLAASDRGLQFGDGCFTTARVRHGEVVWLEAHLQRLQQGCQRLMIDPVDWPILNREMIQLAATEQDAVLKVIITRGTGGRGYSVAGCSTPSRILTLSASPAQYPRWREHGVTLHSVETRLAINPLLAGLKHLNRLEQVLIKAELDAKGADEALVLDTAGRLVECCAANLFWRKGNQLFTPQLTGSGVAGLARARLMQQAAEMGYQVETVYALPDVLAQAEEVLISNALMPLVPVREVGALRFASRQLYHQITAQYQEWT